MIDSHGQKAKNEMEEYIKVGTLYNVRKIWEMIHVVGNYRSHRKYEKTLSGLRW